MPLPPVGERRLSVEVWLIDGAVVVAVCAKAGVLLVFQHREGLINAEEDLFPLRLHRFDNSGDGLAALKATVGAVYPASKGADVGAREGAEGLKLRAVREGEEGAASKARG